MCKDEEDYDLAVKYLHLACRAARISIVAYCFVSNHFHCILLAPDRERIEAMLPDFKKRFAMYYASKYGVESPLRHAQFFAVYLDSDRYLRNAVAYVLRNAKHQSERIDRYPWSSFRAYFREDIPAGRLVRKLSVAQKRQLFRSGSALKDVSWCVDCNGGLVPSCSVDHEYVEAAFLHDHQFFMRIVFRDQDAEMEDMLVENPRKGLPDADFEKFAEMRAQELYHCRLAALARTQRIFLAKLLYHSVRTSPKQIARILGFSAENANEILSKR